MSMDLVKVPVHKSLIKIPLFLGGEKELIGLNIFGCGILFALFNSGILAMVFILIILIVNHFLITKLNRSEPQFFAMAKRFFKYRKIYRDKSVISRNPKVIF